MTAATQHAQEEVAAAIQEHRLIAILRLRDHSRVLDIATTLVENGIRVLEITLDHPVGLRSVERVAASLAGRAMVGAGTVMDVASVRSARDAGARFCVCPHLDPDVLAAANDAGLLPVPGVLTPTEIVRATSLGAPFVKLFPAGAVGVGYLSALRGPLQNVRIIPTGGVTAEDAPAWLRAGAAAVALGNDLIGGSGDLAQLALRARRAAHATSQEGLADQ
jgi:Entner-Doudoroff aldolase